MAGGYEFVFLPDADNAPLIPDREWRKLGARQERRMDQREDWQLKRASMLIPILQKAA